MEQGFWLFFIFQLLALGVLAERMNLVGLRKMALLGGIAGSLGAALCFHLLTIGAIGGDWVRSLLRWLSLAMIMASLVATAASVALPLDVAKKRA